MRCKTQTFPVLLVALFLVISLVIVGISVAGSQTADAPEYILREDTWSVEPKFIELGESVTIKGEVENVGEGSADQYVDLYVNDMENEEDYVTVNLEPGDSTTVEFEFNKTNEIDTYEVKVQQPDSGSQWESQFEVKLETIEYIEIFTEEETLEEDQLTLEAGESETFLAEAYNNEDEFIEEYENEDFYWYNTDDGLFEKYEVGEYEVKAELEGIESKTITVIVEPADAHRLVFVDKPSEDKISAGEVAEYSVEIQDEYGNVQRDGEYSINLEVNEEIVSNARIDEGENKTAINWWTTREPGEYKILAIEEDDQLNTTEEHILTVTEEEKDLAIAGQWWIFPLSIAVIAVISVVYLSDMDKKVLDLDIPNIFNKKVTPSTHEWQRNKESEETEEEIESSEEEVMGN